MDIDIRHLAKKLFPFLWLKHGLISTLPPLSPRSPKKIIALAETITKAILVYSYAIRPVLKYYLERHIQQMMESKIAFWTHVSFLCLKVRLYEDNLFDYFLSICSIISESALFCSSSCFDDVHSYSFVYFVAFFENQLYESFYEVGGWVNLINYIEENCYPELYELMEPYVGQLNYPCDLLPAMIKTKNENLIAGRRKRLMSSRKLSVGEIERDESAKLLTAEIFNWNFIEQQHISDLRLGLFKRKPNVRRKNVRLNNYFQPEETRRVLFEVDEEYLPKTDDNSDTLNSEKNKKNFKPLDNEVGRFEIDTITNQKMDIPFHGSPIQSSDNEQIKCSETIDLNTLSEYRIPSSFSTTLAKENLENFLFTSTDLSKNIVIPMENQKLTVSRESEIQHSTREGIISVMNNSKISSTNADVKDLNAEAEVTNARKSDIKSYGIKNESLHIRDFKKINNFFNKGKQAFENCNFSECNASEQDSCLKSLRMLKLENNILEPSMSSGERIKTDQSKCIKTLHMYASNFNDLHFQTDLNKEYFNYDNFQQAPYDSMSNDNKSALIVQVNTESLGTKDKNINKTVNELKIEPNDFSDLSRNSSNPKSLKVEKNSSKCEEVTSKKSCSNSFPINGDRSIQLTPSEIFVKREPEMLEEKAKLPFNENPSVYRNFYQSSKCMELESVEIISDGKVHYKKTKLQKFCAK